jgi:hypothetical protein
MVCCLSRRIATFGPSKASHRGSRSRGQEGRDAPESRRPIPGSLISAAFKNPARLTTRRVPNCRTIAQGYLTGWRRPRPKDLYEFVVIGGGTCGMNAALMAVKSGHIVAVGARHLR